MRPPGEFNHKFIRYGNSLMLRIVQRDVAVVGADKMHERDVDV